MKGSDLLLRQILVPFLRHRKLAFTTGRNEMLKICDFARLAEVSMTTLRYYDEIGLLKPIHVDPETGYRFYTMDQLPHLHRILAFKELGLGLTKIAEILDEGISPEALQGMLWLRQAQLQQHIQAEQEQLVRIEARLRSLEQGSCLPTYEVVLKAVKPITGVSLHLTTTDLASGALDWRHRRYGEALRGQTYRSSARPSC